MPANILIVDDEKHTRDGLIAALEDDFDVFAASGADEALKMMDAETFDLVLTDLRMGGKSGMSVVDKALSVPYKPACIMMTAFGNVETAVDAMKRGAADFISKPIDLDKLDAAISRALKIRQEKLKEKLDSSASSSAPAGDHADLKFRNLSGEIIAKSRAMNAVLDTARQVAPTKATVMITGQTGTGKELVAHFIHSASPRRDKPFVPVHCAAIPANLLESELFGYERGAFTGAVSRRMGRFEAADGGTLFLDEIGEIDAPTQVKLLRFLETRSFTRLGAEKETNVDVRLVCATNRNLLEMTKTGQFREDLYYRLNVVEIKIPSLHERPEDIRPMVDFYLAHFAAENGIQAPVLSPDAYSGLERYSWRGNVRELRNFCENLVVTNTKKVVSAADLGDRFSSEVAPEPISPKLLTDSKMHSSDHTFSKKENELELIRKALEASHGNKSKAAELLGISRRTLHRKIAAYPELEK